jgi:alpha-mannosidase
VTIVSDGLAEYDARPNGDIAITLLRAVGALSRNDLPERPGHAGWPSPTPAAQCLGTFTARFAIYPHGPRSDQVLESIEHVADDGLLPLQGTTLRSAIVPPQSVMGLHLEGAGLRFLACKPDDSGTGTVLRCVNVTRQPTTATWHCGWPIREAHRARLDETRLEPLAVRNNSVTIPLEPFQVRTIIVR